jgi:hypothetical protein
MGWSEKKVDLASVLQTKQIVAVVCPSAGRFIWLAWQHGRKIDFLCTNVVHLLANDLGDMLVHTPAEWKPCVTARCCAANVSSPHKKSVAWNLCINGVVAQCAYKQGGHFVDHARLLRFVQGEVFWLTDN